MRYFNADVLVQIGTPPGAAPVGALRVSGAGAFRLVRELVSGIDGAFASAAPARSCRDGVLHLSLRPPGAPRGTEKNHPLLPCPVRVFFMPAPASYTREDVAELHLPGSPPLLRAAMDAFVRAGARAADPGEFTFRAFRNGRLTLGQAEAVEQVVSAATAAEKRLGLARLGDRDARRVHAWREKLLGIAALLEAALDFSEEEPDPALVARVAALTRELAESGAGAVSSAAGAAGSAAPHVALVGLANAGKSSLLNALLGRDAAIVSARASTTRDSLRHAVRWDGVELILSDNPGFDPPAGNAAGAGGGGARAAARALERLGGEDIACWVVDASRELDALDEAFARRLSGGGGVVLVRSKCDLPQCVGVDAVDALAERHGVSVLARADVSAAAGAGVSALRALLARLADGAATTAAAAGMWSRREHRELRAALECCRAAAAELSGAGRLELAADDVRRGVGAFSRALGEGYAEEALARIFSQFCIGK